MQKRYHNTANLILIGCVAVVAFTGCSSTSSYKTSDDTNYKRDKMVATLVEQLKTNGFVRTEEEEKYTVYRKSDVTLGELVKQFGLKSIYEFQQLPNAATIDDQLRARLADNVYCFVDERETSGKASVSARYKTAWVWIGRASEIVPVLKAGMYMTDAEPAINKSGAKEVSSKLLYEKDDDNLHYVDLLLDSYQLSDGTLLHLIKKDNIGRWYIAGILVGPNDRMQVVEQFDLTPFLPDEGE